MQSLFGGGEFMRIKPKGRKEGFWKNENGAITILLAILITVFLGFAAMVVDIGLAYHNKSELQTASDSVALAVANSVCKTVDYNPVKNATQAASIKREVQFYFEENGVDNFQYVHGDVENTNIEIYNITNRESVLRKLQDEKDKDIVCIFYKSVDATEDVPGYRYIEVYSHLKSSSIFGGILDIDSYNLTCSSSAKCELILSGNPEALNYQILNLDPDENFDITGPIEDTGLKTFLNLMENATNLGLDFLQNKTVLISEIIMGGKTAYTCPNCGATNREIDVVHAAADGTKFYICPSCGQEMTTDDSNKVAVNVTTSAAVVNGYIHSNGGANINIDTFRMRSVLDDTIVENSEILKEDDYYIYYKNGVKYSRRPILEISKGQEALNLTGNNSHDVFFLGDPITKTDSNGDPVSIYRTIYKSAETAKPWDLTRANKQFIYGAEQIEDPGFINYVHKRYEDLSKTQGSTNVGIQTKLTSGSSYLVSFEGTCSNGTTWTFDDDTGTLKISGSAIEDYGANSSIAPWRKQHQNDIKTVIISDGVSSIGSYAFYNCSNITSVIFPDTVTLIDIYAFYGCSSLEKVVLPNGLRELTNRSFGSAGVKEIYIPATTTNINSNTFRNTNLTTIYGEKGSYAETWAKRYSITFKAEKLEADEVADTSSTISKFDQTVSPISLLGSIDLGNGKSLPNVYDVYDSYYNFDFDVDGKTDSLKDVIDGDVAVAQGLDIKKMDSPVAQIVANRRKNLDSESNSDDIRIQLDNIITGITGDVHSKKNVHAGRTLEEEFDINVAKAVGVKNTNIKTDLNYLEKGYNSKTTLDSGVANTVSKYNSLIKNNITQTLNGEGSVSDTPVVQRDMELVKSDFEDSASSTFASSVANIDGRNYTADDFIAGADGQVKVATQDVINYITGKHTWENGSNGNYLEGAVENGSYDRNGYYHAVKSGHPYVCAPYYAKAYSSGQVRGFIVRPETSYWVKNYMITAYNKVSNGNRGILLKNGTESTRTNLIINGESTTSGYAAYSVKEIDIGSYADMVVNGSVYAQTYFKVGANSVAVINGDLVAENEVYVYDGGTLIVTGNITSKGKNVIVGVGAKLYCGGNITMSSTFNIWDNARIHCDGNIIVGTTMEGASANYSVMTVNGSLNINGDSTSIQNGVGYSSYLAVKGNIYGPKADFYNNGTILCYDSFRSGVLTNGSKLYAMGDILSTGAITNNLYIYSVSGSLISQKNGITNNGTILANAVNSSSGGITNNSLLYSKGIVNCGGITNAASGKFYAAGKITSSGNMTLRGWFMTDSMIEAPSNQIYAYGILVTGGCPKDAGGNDVADETLASYISGLNINCIDIFDTAQVYIKGRVKCNTNGLVIKSSGSGDLSAFIMIDGGTSDSGYALQTNTYLQANTGGQIYVNGNAYIGATDDAVRIGPLAYLYVSGSIEARGGWALNAQSFMHAGSVIANTTLNVGVNEMASDVAAQTGFVVDGNITASGEIHLFALSHIGGNINCTSKIDVDDFSNTFVGGDINASQIYLWDSGNLYVQGNITTSSTDAHSLYFAADNSLNMLLCAGNVSSASNIEAYDEGILMVMGTTTANGFVSTYNMGIIYSKDDISLNSASAMSENILFTDADLISVYSSKTTLTVASEIYIHYINLVNISIVEGVVKENTTTLIQNDIIWTAGTLELGKKGGNTIVINKGVTVYAINSNIQIKGDVVNYGRIICYSGNLLGNGGNITIYDDINGKYCSLTNYGTVYCEQNLYVNGTNHSKTGDIWYNDGLSIQNGNKTNKDPVIYVGGDCNIKAGLDNFGQMYVAGDLDTTQGYDAKTFASGQNSVGAGIDNENNSVLMIGGTVDTHGGGKKGHTSVVSRSNSVFYAGSNVKTSRNFIVGNAFLLGGTNSQKGDEQYKYFSSDSYKGLDTSVAGYKVCTVITPNALKVIQPSGGTPGATEISAADIEGIVFDEYGNRVEDVSTLYGKYVVYSYTANGKSGSSVYDFGFAYIDGTLTTGTTAKNYVKPFGKSILYVAGNKTHSSDDLYNPNYAIETHYIFTFPYSRVYCGGNLKTYGGDGYFGDGIALNEWFYTHLYIDGNAEFPGKVKMRDATKTIVNGSITCSRYVEIGKAPDGGDEAIDENNYAFVQCDGNFTATGIKLFARATLNANGNVSSTLKYLTLCHHANLRAAGSISCSQADIGSCSTVYSGKDFTAFLSTMKIRDNCTISVGGNGGGNLNALGYIEIGKHEDEQYKYNSWEQNRLTSSNIDYEIPDDGTTGEGSEETPSGDDSVLNTKITCPCCGTHGTIAGGQFTTATTNGIRTYTCVGCQNKGCADCADNNYTFDDTADAFEGDSALGSTVHVNGTINSVTGYLKLFANTKAYATKSIRSFRYITLRHHAGLYVATNNPASTGIIYDYDDQNRLLDIDGNVVTNFYVDTDINSAEYGNVYFYPANVTLSDGSTKAVRLYGFAVEADYSESFTPDETQGRIYQNLLYYYEDGEKVYHSETYEVSVDGEVKEATDYYGISGSEVVLGAGDEYVGTTVNSSIIRLIVTEGSVTSYGPLSVNTYAQLYSSGDVKSYGKTYIGDCAIVYAKGDYVCTKVISLSSLIQGDSVCGFEMKHGHLYSGGNVRLYTCSEIEGGTIDAVGNITFNSIYTNYDYEGENRYTDVTDVDLFVCSENGNIDFNCIYSSTGGITYAPNGTISADGVYFEHSGSFIAGDNNINAFYINLHRLDNLSTVDLKWVTPGKVYLCENED